mgnify:CR=1 FL=1
MQKKRAEAIKDKAEKYKYEMIESSKDKYLKSKMNDMKIVFSKFEETIQKAKALLEAMK